MTLIDRDELLADMRQLIADGWGYKELLNAVENTPPIVNQVVRCGECKYFSWEAWGEPIYNGVTDFCRFKSPGLGYIGLQYNDPYSFCSHGERKDGEESGY